MADQSLKKDKGKDRWDLLPLECIEGMVKVLTFGANKYRDNGWKDLMENDEGALGRVVASFRRHQLAIEKHGIEALDLNKNGEVDKDHSGLPHIDHIMCNVLFLKYYQLHVAKMQDALNKYEEKQIETNRRSPYSKIDFTPFDEVGNVPGDLLDTLTYALQEYGFPGIAMLGSSQGPCKFRFTEEKEEDPHEQWKLKNLHSW